MVAKAREDSSFSALEEEFFAGGERIDAAEEVGDELVELMPDWYLSRWQALLCRLRGRHGTQRALALRNTHVTA